jgi:hypothetical protein
VVNLNATCSTSHVIFPIKKKTVPSFLPSNQVSISCILGNEERRGRRRRELTDVNEEQIY